MKNNTQLNQTEISSFCSQIALLVKAGITPLEALNIMLSDMKSTSGEELLTSIIDVCKQGEPFYRGLESSNAFPDYCIYLIKLGEQSGNLEDCLSSLATYYEKQEYFKESIKSAVSYPLIMIGMMAIIIYVLISNVLPIFSDVFSDLGNEMTGLASSLMEFGRTLNQYNIIFVLLVAIIILSVFLCMKLPSLQSFSYRVLTKFPLTKAFYEKYAYQRFANGLFLTLSSGIDTFTSLDMVYELVGNPIMKDKIKICIENLKNGDSLAEALFAAKIFNNVHIRMISVGAKTGNIDTVMGQIANAYEKETEKKMHNIVSVIEPTLVIILSLIVGLILLSVILPLMGIMSSIG